MEPVYDPANLFRTFDPGQTWFKDNKIAKAVEYFLWEFSNLNAPGSSVFGLSMHPGWRNHFLSVSYTRYLTITDQ
jgi:hypothetical protein